MGFDVAGGRRLLLAGGGQAWAWVAAGAVAAVALVVLSRAERSLVSRRAGLCLLALRLAAAAALVAALFEPIGETTTTQTVRGRVVVAVDASESMATVDPGRTPAERRSLAGSLGLGPAEEADALPRREVARRLLAGSSAPLARLAADHAVEAVLFARDAAPAASLDAAAASLARPVRPDDPAAAATDWSAALATALAGEGDDAPVLGVVLLSDGLRNGPDDASVVDRLAARGIPVYPILIGSAVPPRDVAVASIRAPESAYLGDVATVEATIKVDGQAPGATLDVTLSRPGAEPQHRAATVPADGSRPTASFRVPLGAAGPAAFTVSVAAPAGDARADNDARSSMIQVVDDSARVLLVDGEARWEFRYLRNALSRDPRVRVDCVVARQPTLADSPGTAYPTSLPPRPAATAEADPLGSYDAIVLGDATPAELGGDLWARLDAYVASRGGTLIVLPGPRSWPTAHLADADARSMLPVLDPRVVAPDPATPDPAHPSLPPGSAAMPTDAALADPAAWPMLQLGVDPAATRRVWAGLPRQPWMLTGPAKPGAAVLASGPEAAGPRGEAPAAIASQPYGLGKVLWVGLDGTWRWRHRVGDAYHHRFWGQAVRWAALGKLPAGDRRVRFGPTRPRAPEGEPVPVRARFSEGFAGLGPDALIAARFTRAGSSPDSEAVSVVPLRPVPGQPLAFEGSAPSLPAGSYAIRLDAPTLDLTADGPLPKATLVVSPRDTPERVELAARREALAALARATGGRVFADHEAARLPPLLRSKWRTKTRTEETSLWDNPYTLAAFFAILTAEWVVRKRAGLP